MPVERIIVLVIGLVTLVLLLPEAYSIWKDFKRFKNE